MAALTNIKFIDLPKREQQERDRLTARLAYLKDKETKRGGNLPSDEASELARLTAIKDIGALNPLSSDDSYERVDALFVAVRDLFNDKPALIGGDGRHRLLNFTVEGELNVCPAETKNFPPIVTISLVLGILANDEVIPPRVMVVPRIASKPAAHRSARAEVEAEQQQKQKCENDVLALQIVSDQSDAAYLKFVDAFYKAIGEVSGAFTLASAVLPILDEEGDPTGKANEPGKVECKEFARVVRCLIERGVTKPVPQLRRRVNECLNKIQQVGEDSGISLPDLNEASNYQIQEENVRLMGPIICSAMFEELKVFQVLDKLVEQAQNGTLVTSRGKAGEMLYKYWKETPNRMSEGERSNLYALTLGTPGGDSSGMPNRDFNDLWLRFVSSVSSLVRQRTTDQLLRSTFPAAISQQQVRKAARDLALNLSSRGYGMTLYLALELQSQIKMIIQLLGDKDIMGIYGARDMWQVIDQVATLELAGGARNTARYRTLATCGAIITAWLANNVKKYNSPTSRMIIDTDEVLSIDPATSSDATRTPTDYDLVNACELWLADTATSDDQIEQISQNPRESPMMTSRPVQIPAIAREMLDQAGIGVPGFGLGMGMRRQ
jgi:hypothetical protein